MQRRLRPALASIRRFLDTGNVVRFLVALVLAFGLWAWVTYENDPEITRTLGGIPVTMQDLGSNLEVVGDSPVVDVTVQGPQSIVSPLERESVAAYADMSEIDGPGELEVDVEVDVPSGTRVRDVVPESVVVELDRISSRADVPVDVRQPSDVPQNFEVGAIDPEVESVTVSGPEASVEEVVSAQIPVQIDGRTSSFTDSWSAVPVNSSGDEVSGVEIEPAEIPVAVTLDLRGQVRKVIPVIVGDDALASGYELVRTTVLPSDEVVVDGPEDEVSEVFFVSTVPVDVSGWDESQIVRNVEIDVSRLPENVTVDTETVHVSIEIRQQVHQREISEIPISVMNAAPGTSVSIEPRTATVVLEGSRNAVDAVNPEDITAFVNVASSEPGTYEFDLNIIVPPQVQYRRVEPQIVDVVIEEDSEEEDGDSALDGPADRTHGGSARG